MSTHVVVAIELGARHDTAPGCCSTAAPPTVSVSAPHVTSASQLVASEAFDGTSVHCSL